MLSDAGLEEKYLIVILLFCLLQLLPLLFILKQALLGLGLLLQQVLVLPFPLLNLPQPVGLLVLILPPHPQQVLNDHLAILVELLDLRVLFSLDMVELFPQPLQLEVGDLQLLGGDLLHLDLLLEDPNLGQVILPECEQLPGRRSKHPSIRI